jgi:hypothetical protein
MKSILSFAGARTTMGTGTAGAGYIIGKSGQRVTAKEATTALGRLSRAINTEARGRFSKRQWEEVDAAGVGIAVARQKGVLKSKARAAKDMEYNFRKAMGGSAKHAKLVEAGIKGIIRAGGGPLAEELKKRKGRLGGPHMAQMLRVVRRATGIDVGRKLQAMTGAIAAAGGASLDKAERRSVARALGIQTGEKGRAQQRLSAALKSGFVTPASVARARRGELGGTVGGLVRAADREKTGRVARLGVGRRLISSPAYRRLSSAIEAARKRHGTAKGSTVKVTKDENVKKETANFIREASKKGDAGTRRAAQAIARNVSSDEKLRKTLKGMESLVAGKTAGASKKGGRRRRPRGRAVAFQGQAQSFQSQITQALRTTSHTLRQVQNSMKAMESRLKAGK